MLEITIAGGVITAIGLILLFCPKLFFVFCRTFFINDEEPSTTFINITKMFGISITIIGIFTLIVGILSMLI